MGECDYPPDDLFQSKARPNCLVCKVLIRQLEDVLVDPTNEQAVRHI